MHILNFKRLKPADILFTREKWDATSIGIRTASGSRFSHAILYVDSHSYIDSDRNGVHANNPQYKLFDSPNDVAVKRHKAPLSAETVKPMHLSVVGYFGSASAPPGYLSGFFGWRSGSHRNCRDRHGRHNLFCTNLDSEWRDDSRSHELPGMFAV